MKGTQPVRIANKRVSFKFELHSSVTIVKGDSGSGKTTLYELIASHTRLGDASGVTIQCAKPCVAFVDLDWENQLSDTRDSIVFIDEGSSYIATEEFAAAVQKTDNYYVIFTREDLHNLPYSIDEIYRIKTSGKRYHTFVRLYKSNEQHVYSMVPRRKGPSEYDTLLTEDSKAGFQFYESHFKDTDITCESAGNNSSVYKRLDGNQGESVFVVADGAAFGAEADRVLKLQSMYASSVSVCLPESFEWLLLKSGLVDVPDLENVLADTSEYAESGEYFSWEQFYTAYLQENTRETVFRYTKRKLPEAFMVPENAARVLSEIATGNIR